MPSAKSERKSNRNKDLTKGHFSASQQKEQQHVSDEGPIFWSLQ
jgi:hypothetical protein